MDKISVTNEQRAPMEIGTLCYISDVGETTEKDEPG